MSESSSPSYYLYSLDIVAFTVGLALITSGVIGTFINPWTIVRIFGLPTATKDNIVFFPAATGRNLSAGTFVWTLTFLGERKLLGIYLLCLTWTGIADIKILYEHPQGQKMWGHISNIFILWILGPILINS
ncbi:hypothetical protein EV356DRAFT_529265 [Viridothelium virens]|uniref:DUF4267 domain-containing protein n=1 Tax=Viridothelium virens TaxID=1048519 RepID=A0A6A6HKC7_VIRVR|nr:hypothetical protein EV356DRAFT_529265 [Viridothelium virens]